MKRTALIIVLCAALCLTLGAAPRTEQSDRMQVFGPAGGLAEEDRETFENIIAYLWWYGDLPVGEVYLTEGVQILVARALLNDARLPGVREMLWYTDNGYALTEKDMDRLFFSLSGEPAPGPDTLTQYYLSYADGMYSGQFAAGDMAIYVPEADIIEASVSGGRMTLRGFVHVSCNVDYTETFYKFEAVLEENGDSIFAGYSFGSLDVEELDRTVRDITANSVLAPQAGNTYGPANAFDRDLATAWVEGSAGTGAGSSITFSFDGTERVCGVAVLPGYWKNRDVYVQNGRPTALDISFSDGSHGTMTLQSAPAEEYAEGWDSFEYVLFDRPVETSSVTITITGAVAGTAYEDTCIAEIQLLK